MIPFITLYFTLNNFSFLFIIFY